MKKSYILIALAMVAALTTVSCKCSSKKSQDPTQEEVQKMKQALADSVLAYIDDCVEKLCDASSNSFQIKELELTDEEKMVKPDYLLDPSVAATLVTKTQKVNALAIYVIELGVRKIYDMPQEETKEVIAKLAVEINHPIDVDLLMTSAIPTSEKIKKEYEICKERGDLAYFWQLQHAILCEVGYIMANNPDLFYAKITEDQWQAYCAKIKAISKSIYELAKYDEEIALLSEIKNRNKVFVSNEEHNTNFRSKESAKQSRIANRDKFIAKRNALLQ